MAGVNKVTFTDERVNASLVVSVSSTLAPQFLFNLKQVAVLPKLLH